MIETLGVILPIIIYFLLIVLLVVIIALGIKVFKTINKVNNIIEDFEYKMESINEMFKFTGSISNKIADIGNGLINCGLRKITKMLGIGNREEDKNNG